MSHKLFRDPVHDYISINRENRWLIDLINCPEFQRLRYINQLGLSHFTYPGATHTRFSHCLGVLFLVQQCLTYLDPIYGKNSLIRLGKLNKKALLAAALLHDVGHGPFSHVTEGILGKHEEMSVKLILSDETEINKVLHKEHKSLPNKVSALIAEHVPGGATAPLWQKSLISSQLDMDRLDYLRRDALFTGAEYGNFDAFRIIHTMQLEEHPKQKDIWVVWPEKTKYAIEEYIFSRFYMYQAVYFHHTTRGFEKLLQKILERAKTLYPRRSESVLSPMDVFLKKNVDEVNVRDFLLCTDNLVISQLQEWQNNNNEDKILADLARRFLCRDGFASLELPLIGLEGRNRIEKVHKYLKRNGYQEPEYYFLEDSAAASIYRPYRSGQETEEQSSATSIILFDPAWKAKTKTGLKEISDVPGLERLKAVTDRTTRLSRYYYPKEHRKPIEKILRG